MAKDQKNVKKNTKYSAKRNTKKTKKTNKTKKTKKNNKTINGATRSAPPRKVTISIDNNNMGDPENVVNPKMTVGVVRANWCGHCRDLEPEWDLMKSQIEEDSALKNKCEFVKIESTDSNYENEKARMEQKMNGNSLTVDGFPTIFMIRDGKLIKYNDCERTAPNLVNWINQIANSSNSYGGKRTKKANHEKTTMTKTKSWFW